MAEKRKAGRPRSADARRRILAAARALLNEGGMPAVTMEAVAARAGVGKPTIYRAWPNAQAVAMAAFLENARMPKALEKKSGTLAALRAHLHSTAEAFTSRTGRTTAQMIASAQGDSELLKVFRNQFIAKRREEGRRILAHAAAEGSIRADCDIEAALDVLYAPLYLRLLIGHAPLDAAFVDAVVDIALEGLRPRKAAPARGRRKPKPTPSRR